MLDIVCCIAQYVYDNTFTDIILDVYDESGSLTDLWLRVYLNNQLKFEGVDYDLQTTENNEIKIVFRNDLSYGDIVILKSRSKTAKNDKGFYEIPSNLEKNPLNNSVSTFTLDIYTIFDQDLV